MVRTSSPVGAVDRDGVLVHHVLGEDEALLGRRRPTSARCRRSAAATRHRRRVGGGTRRLPVVARPRLGERGARAAARGRRDPGRPPGHPPRGGAEAAVGSAAPARPRRRGRHHRRPGSPPPYRAAIRRRRTTCGSRRTIIMRLPPRAVSVGDVRRSRGAPVTKPVHDAPRSAITRTLGTPAVTPGAAVNRCRTRGRRRRSVAGPMRDPPVRRPRHPRPRGPLRFLRVGRPAASGAPWSPRSLSASLDGQPGAVPGGGGSGHRRGHHRRRQRPARCCCGRGVAAAARRRRAPLSGALRHRFAVTNWLPAAFRGAQLRRPQGAPTPARR